MNDLQDKVDSSNVSWSDLFQMASVKFKAISQRSKAKWILTIGVFFICLNFLAMVLYLPLFYTSDKYYTVPGDLVKASHFTQFEDSSTTLNALSVHTEFSNNWISYLNLKLKYGNVMKYMEEEDRLFQITGNDKGHEGKVIDTINVNEMVTAAYIAASKEAGMTNNYETKYMVMSTPSNPEDTDNLNVEPGDQILLVDGKPISSRLQVDYLTARNTPKELKVSRLGEELIVKSSLYGAYVKITNEVKDKRALQEAVKLFDNNYVGNSAGTAVAVELYSQFTEDIIKGRNIAITGAIDADGKVSIVGGIPAKTVLAEKSGADIMFVPFDDELANNYSDANKVNKAMESDMEIIPVQTLHEVI